MTILRLRRFGTDTSYYRNRTENEYECGTPLINKIKIFKFPVIVNILTPIPSITNVKVSVCYTFTC